MIHAISYNKGVLQLMRYGDVFGSWLKMKSV
jgi:hypothetical protein